MASGASQGEILKNALKWIILLAFYISFTFICIQLTKNMNKTKTSLKGLGHAI